MQYARQEKALPIAPRVIIHGGAGNITRENLSRDAYQQYRHSLLSILQRASIELQKPNAAALDVATYAVSLLEEDPLFNAGHGAVYTRDGTHELEASIMVSRNYRKRGVGVMQVRHAKSPIKLARELLVRGELKDGGGAQGHCQLAGDTPDSLARDWKMDLVKPSYFWTRKRWDEHRRGLGLEHDDATYERHRREADDAGESRKPAELDCKADALHPHDDPSWDGKEYLPQGTVGCVVLDSDGVICVCTSTGGLTNKLAGRIGDTPTLGAGFWAEQWYENETSSGASASAPPLSIPWLTDCLTSYSVLPSAADDRQPKLRAAAISGTGNGDSFLRINAVRTAAAMARYTGSTCSLQSAVTAIAGPHGQLQQSAGDRWRKTGEGEGGMIGIELKDERGHIVYDHNCGGMFRAWVDDNGQPRFGVFQDEKDVQT